MGRLSKIKLELIQEANKRLLGEAIMPNFNGTGILVATHPITKKDIESKIRRSNFEKVIEGMDKGKPEIMIKNLEGKEFYLVRV